MNGTNPENGWRKEVDQVGDQEQVKGTHIRLAAPAQEIGRQQARRQQQRAKRPEDAPVQVQEVFDRLFGEVPDGVAVAV